MNSARRVVFDQEIREAEQRIAVGELDRAFAHLERAHVIGQPFVWPHARAHWLMCRVELRRGRGAAVVGQVLRIILGTIGSAIGVVPVGNTGGTNISMFRRLPVSPELQAIIDGSSSADTMKHEIIGTPPEDDEDAVRRDFAAFVRDLEATPGKRVSVVFGFAWGNRDWLALDLTGSELRARVDAAEASGLGAIGSDDLHITLPDLGVERRYCHEDDVHVIADDQGLDCLEAQRLQWLDMGWDVHRRELA